MSRELDLRVAAALGQTGPPEEEHTFWEQNEDGTWTGEHFVHSEDGEWLRETEYHDWPAHYGMSIFDAMMLFDWMAERGWVKLSNGDWASKVCDFIPHKAVGPHDAHVSGDTWAEAIRGAFLVAVGDGDDG